MEVFRITSPRWADQLQASGFAGRWNSNGVKVIYAASSRSLACLESVVHRHQKGLSEMFRVVVIFIPDDLSMDVLTLDSLPDGWHLPNEEAYELCRKFGDRWVSRNSSAILSLPSAIVKNEKNFLINPGHPEFSQIKIIYQEPFLFDPRI